MPNKDDELCGVTADAPFFAKGWLNTFCDKRLYFSKTGTDPGNKNNVKEKILKK